MRRTEIRVPVEATMRRLPDGCFEMVDATYIAVDPDLVARWLMAAFRVPMGQEGGESIVPPQPDQEREH